MMVGPMPAGQGRRDGLLTHSPGLAWTTQLRGNLRTTPYNALLREWPTPTAIVNASGTVEERYEYSPYGAVTVLSASGTLISGDVGAYGCQYLFQGGRQDLRDGALPLRAPRLQSAERHLDATRSDGAGGWGRQYL